MNWWIAFIIYITLVGSWGWMAWQILRETYRQEKRRVREASLLWEG